MQTHSPVDINATCGPQEHHGSRQLSEKVVLGQFIPAIYHFNMLQDEDRVGAFRDALEMSVRPGMHVLELGGGTGILSFLAAELGARVTCVELNPELTEYAKRFVRDNQVDDRINVIQADAASFVPADPVQVVVCEMLHVGLLREKQVQVIRAFKENYRKKFGGELPRLIPEASVLMAQPVQQSYDFFGYRAAVPLFQAPLAEQPRTRELASFQPYAYVQYEEDFEANFQVDQNVVLEKSGRANAIRFVTQNILRIDEVGKRAITWANQCLVLPLQREVAKGVAGQQGQLRFAYQAGEPIEQLQSTLRFSIHDHNP